jgi:hypothetical protein
MPVSGATPITAARLMTACPHTSVVSPAANRFPNGSLHRSAMRIPVYANTAKAPMTSVVPSSPSSSPTIAKIMSVWASGR